MARRSLVPAAVLVVLSLLGTGAPAGATTGGTCSAMFNGIDDDRIDALGSPLELDSTDTLVFEGTTDGGTLSARVALVLGPVTIRSQTTTYSFPQEEFASTLALEEASLYGVGLFRVVGTVDQCRTTAWVRISGRFPLTTVIGLIGAGLALGGIAGQLGAIVSRRRWSRVAAASGGIATGTGIALLGQQAGRLQVSYPSMVLMIVLAASVGAGLAAALNPTLRSGRRERARALAEVMRPAPPRSLRPPLARQAASSTRAPTPDGWPSWCHVLAAVDVFDLHDHTRVVARLEPGNDYLGRREVGGWVEVVTEEGRAGWVARGALRLSPDRTDGPFYPSPAPE